jgi:hypothetical protein
MQRRLSKRWPNARSKEVNMGVRRADGRFVIQRASESRCEWWTGSGWSDDETKAARYDEEPDPGSETADESATVESSDVLATTRAAMDRVRGR